MGSPPPRTTCTTIGPAAALLILAAVMAPVHAGSREPSGDPAVPHAESLPKVLIIGDSVSIGYTPYVAELLKGQVAVAHNPGNARDTNYGLANLDKWLQGTEWDVIHFNWGLWDLRHDQGLAGPPRVGLQQYRDNLAKLVARLQATGARLIWATTTPVPAGTATRIAGAELDYNRAARAVIDKAGIPVNDLHALARPRLAKYQFSKNVHFHATGSQALALQTANKILEALGRPKLAHPWGRPWQRHTVDDSSRGADGVRLADADGDGRADIVTGWEEGGVTRVYLHPGRAAVRRRWPAVTVGTTPSAEDAVFAELDADGSTDVVTSCEGSNKTIYVHWAPTDKAKYLDASAWLQQPLPASAGLAQWMFCTPVQLDGKAGTDLVAGSKGAGASIGWFESPARTHDLDAWKWHPISQAGWIMSLRIEDMDGDRDPDIVTSDRKGPLRGCRWLENPGPGPSQALPWKNHFIGARDHEAMFMTIADFDADGLRDVLVVTKEKSLQKVIYFRRLDSSGRAWKSETIPLPENIGTGKGVAAGDIDRNGTCDLVFSCENAAGASGLMWLSRFEQSPWTGWLPHEISGPEGIKFDRIELLDLDADGDLDVLSCEESAPDAAGRRKGLGVIWYENPAIRH